MNVKKNRIGELATQSDITATADQNNVQTNNDSNDQGWSTLGNIFSAISSGISALTDPNATPTQRNAAAVTLQASANSHQMTLLILGAVVVIGGIYMAKNQKR